MRFKDLVIAWHNGTERGAAARFAARIKVSNVVVGKWMNGKEVPGEKTRPRIAKELRVSVEALMDSFKSSKFEGTPDDLIASALKGEHLKLLEKIRIEEYVAQGMETVTHAQIISRLIYQYAHGILVPAGSPQGQPLDLGPVDRILPPEGPGEDVESQPVKDRGKQTSAGGNK